MIIWKKIRTGEWIPWTYLLMLVFDLVYNSLVYYGDKGWEPIQKRGILRLLWSADFRVPGLWESTSHFSCFAP